MSGISFMREILFGMFLIVGLTVCVFFVLWVLGYDIERKDRFGIVIGEIILIGLISVMVYSVLI